MKLTLKDSPFLVCDLIGFSLVATLISVGLWSTFVHLPDSSDRLRKSQAELTQLNQSLRTLERNLNSSNAELINVEAEVEERGALPKSSPVDANLQTITRLIQSNKIELLNVDPIEQKEYPGLMELKYKVQVRSGFDAMMGFLEGFEAEPFWADLTGIKIHGAPGSLDSKNSQHRTEFVVSLFAAHTATETGGQQ